METPVLDLGMASGPSFPCLEQRERHARSHSVPRKRNMNLRRKERWGKEGGGGVNLSNMNTRGTRSDGYSCTPVKAIFLWPWLPCGHGRFCSPLTAGGLRCARNLGPEPSLFFRSRLFTSACCPEIRSGSGQLKPPQGPLKARGSFSNFAFKH